MKPKTIIALAVVLAILLALVMVQKKAEKRPSLIEQADLKPLLPEDASATAVSKLEFYTGDAPEEKLVLARMTSNAPWRLTSHYDVLVDQDKAAKFVETLTGLSGELRETVASDQGLAPYELGDAEALHVKGYRKDSDEPLFHVLAGKAPKYDNAFMRRADGQDVYVVDANLRNEAGIRDGSANADSVANSWIDKTVVDLDKDAIERVALTAPDKTLVFERTVKAPEELEEDAEELELAEPEYQWTLAEGGLPGQEYKESVLDSLKSALAPLRVTGVVDPSTPEKWGLDEVKFRCVVGLADQDEDVVLEVGRPQGKGNGYLRVASSDEDTIYEVSSYNLDRVFPKGNKLYDLAKLDVTENAMERIDVRQPQGAYSLVQVNGDWKVDAPKADLEIQQTTIDDIARTLARLEAQDYADSMTGTGLDSADRMVTVHKGDETFLVAIGGRSAYMDGYYARFPGTDTPLAVSAGDVEKVFIEPRNLYRLALFDVDAEDINRVAVTPYDGAPYTLARGEDDAWTITAGEETGPAVADEANRIAQTLATLEPLEVHFETSDLAAETVATVVWSTADDPDRTLTLAPEHDGRARFKVDGVGQVLSMPVYQAGAIMPALESLKQAEPAAEPEPAEEAPEAMEEPAASAE